MKGSWTDKEWAEFGKKIYDASQKIFADKPVQEVVIPFFDDDGFLCRAIVRDIPTFVEVKTLPDGCREFVHYHKASDGSKIRVGTVRG